MDNVPHAARIAADGVSATIAISTIAGILPPLAAALAIVWYCIQIYDRIRAGRREIAAIAKRAAQDD